MRSTGSALRHPVFAGMLVVVACEWALPRAFEARLPVEEGRNARVLRDWDAYLTRTAVPREGELRILLISNSQGRGPEYPVALTYPALLEQRLGQRDGSPPVRVVNWSVASNRVPEAIVLLARARALRPHLLLCAFPPNWFRPEDYAGTAGPTPLRRLESDVTETAWYYRDALPEAFRRHYLDAAAPVRAAVARHWPAYRYRDLPAFAAAHRWPALRAALPGAGQARWFDVDLGRQPRQHLATPPNYAAQAPHRALLEMFAEAAAGVGARRVFALQPLWHPIHPRHEPAVRDLQSELESHGFVWWDLHASVPWPEFLTGSMHLTDAGHRRLAGEIADRLEAAPLLPPP